MSHANDTPPPPPPPPLTDEIIAELRSRGIEPAPSNPVATIPAVRLHGNSKYRPEYCAMIIAHMAQGFSAKDFTTTHGISYACILDWAKRHPEFKEAYAMAQEACVVFFERRLRLVAMSGGEQGQVQALIKTLQARDPAWRDKTEIVSTNLNVNVDATKDDRIKSIEQKFARVIEHDAAEDVPRQLN
jgi:hypothetical protein